MSVSKCLIGCLIVFQALKGAPAQGQEKVFSTLDSCYSHIEVYSSYWKKDSLGKNGFRELMANTLLGKCSFSGEEWEKIRRHLGSPNYKFDNGDTKTYRYRLNYLTKNVKDIGTMLLDVKVDSKGIVIGLSIFSIDG